MIAVKSTDSAIKETLKSFCCSNGWCYGLFWGFDQSNSLLLTLKDAYCEEQFQALANTMLHQVHTLGGGLIGQVALSQKHKWIHSESRQEVPDPYDQSQDDFEFFNQFSFGIKTVALISVEPCGVLQFGSTGKFPENGHLVEDLRERFKAVVIRIAQEIKRLEREPFSDSQLMINSHTSYGSLFSCDIQNFRHNAVLEHDRVQTCSKSPTNEFEQLLFEPSCHFDFSGSQTLTTDTDHSYQQATYDPCKDSKPMSGLLTLDELIQKNDYRLMDDFSQWSSLRHSTGLIPLPNMSGDNSPMFCASESIITNSMQSSITDTLGSSNQRKFSNSSGTGKMLKRPEIDPECNNPTVGNDPVLNVDGLRFTTDVSGCISEKNAGTYNSLFSKLGLDQILDGLASFGTGSYAKTRFEDQWASAAKRRKTNNYSWIRNQERVQSPVYDLETRNIAEVKSEASTKEKAASFISDMYREKSSSSPKRQEEIAKTGKKKAKPGTKPRPKDRQMIQDRLAELRHLIPNGEKMSIDRLLERTIRHLNYMQSLTKHVDVLKQIDKPKAEVSSRKDNIGNCGVTWAYEVGDQTMVCPLVVEDLNTQGQMLIEVLCEEHGFFLEIVDIVRSFGLIVLKGKMELRETKIWARFVVEAEANRRVTRHEIFSSLIQLLQMNVNNAADSNDRFGGNNNKAMSSEAFLFDNYHQTSVSFPVNLANNPLYCASVRQCS